MLQVVLKLYRKIKKQDLKLFIFEHLQKSILNNKLLIT